MHTDDKILQCAQEGRKQRAQRIEAAWREHAARQQYKRGTVKYANAEREFFIGAMKVLQIVFPNEDNPEEISKAIPPSWVFNQMIGRPICEEK